MSNDQTQKASRLRIIGIFVILSAMLLEACSPSTAETEATFTPKSRASALSRPSATMLPTSRPSPTTTPKATATALPTKISTLTLTPTPTLLPGMVQVKAGSKVVPILLYHHISDQAGERYVISVRSFRAQMKHLYDEGYQTIGVSQLADTIRYGGALPEKAVVLTFDDGYLDTYTNAFPVLQEFGFTGVTYIITSTLEKSKSYGYMQERELKALLAAGWEIGSHSVTHYDLKKKKLGAGNEIQQSKETLEALLRVPVRSFCYPYGVASQAIKDLVLDAGYVSAVGLGIHQTHTRESLYYLSRMEVTRSMSLSAFQKLLEPSQDEVALNDAFKLTPAAP